MKQEYNMMPQTQSRVARKAAAMIENNRHRINQRELAYRLGWSKPNIISMIKTGVTKMPLDKAGPFAEELNEDPVAFLRLVLAEYMPDLLTAIEKYMTGPMVTRNELEMVQVIRQATNGENPHLSTAQERTRLAEWARGLSDFQNEGPSSRSQTGSGVLAD